ncbi:acyltransferase [Undibacterium sp. SXout20W]|uniref:acyltransferase n=1 Tax=Undibacterium sp. SXout20W TaxID=3413051 RepID=UPI003BF290AA
MSSYIARGVESNFWSLVCVQRDAQIQRGTLLHVNKLTNNAQIYVGERAFVGQNCYFSSGHLIDIGRDSLVGASCNFLGAGHEYHDPTMPYAKAKVVSYGRIILEPNTWIGTGSSIIGNVRIGFGTVVAANSSIRKSLPPLCLAAGSPAKILKLFNWNTREWEPVSCQESELDALIQTHLQRLPTIEEFTSALDTNLN